MKRRGKRFCASMSGIDNPEPVVGCVSQAQCRTRVPVCSSFGEKPGLPEHSLNRPILANHYPEGGPKRVGDEVGHARISGGEKCLENFNGHTRHESESNSDCRGMF